MIINNPLLCKNCPAERDYDRVLLGLSKEIRIQDHKFDTYETIMYGKAIEDIIARYDLDSDAVYKLVELRQDEALEMINNYKGDRTDGCC